MADLYAKLQAAAGKFFTLDDIDLRALEISDQWANGRIRPSSAEFMAKLVVDVATNMDMDAEARSRPREPTRPSAGDYDVEELTPAQEQKAEGAEAEPGCPSVHTAGDTLVSGVRPHMWCSCARLCTRCLAFTLVSAHVRAYTRASPHVPTIVGAMSAAVAHAPCTAGVG